MNTMVEMRLEARKQGGSERFACNLEFWNLMLELGEAFGWKPSGAAYLAAPVRGIQKLQSVRHGYQPGAWRDSKLVDVADASGWADALDTARASPHFDKLTTLRRDSNDASAVEYGKGEHDDTAFFAAMNEFIQYLRKGAFSFSSGDADDIAVMSARK
ncbi:MAG TPA: hypothetical protein VET48_01335 [Steroidobacteraceae bacterium]|nr:hypothetical protein [Steroidobacteraceae bacterium]